MIVEDELRRWLNQWFRADNERIEADLGHALSLMGPDDYRSLIVVDEGPKVVSSADGISFQSSRAVACIWPRPAPPSDAEIDEFTGRLIDAMRAALDTGPPSVAAAALDVILNRRRPYRQRRRG